MIGPPLQASAHAIDEIVFDSTLSCAKTTVPDG